MLPYFVPASEAVKSVIACPYLKRFPAEGHVAVRDYTDQTPPAEAAALSYWTGQNYTFPTGFSFPFSQGPRVGAAQTLRCRMSQPRQRLGGEMRGRRRILTSALARLPAPRQKTGFGCAISVCWPHIYTPLSTYNKLQPNHCSWSEEIETHSPTEWPTSCRRRTTRWVTSPWTLWILKWIKAYGLIFHHGSIFLSEYFHTNSQK